MVHFLIRKWYTFKLVYTVLITTKLLKISDMYNFLLIFINLN